MVKLRDPNAATDNPVREKFLVINLLFWLRLSLHVSWHFSQINDHIFYKRNERSNKQTIPFDLGSCAYDGLRYE